MLLRRSLQAIARRRSRQAHTTSNGTTPPPTPPSSSAPRRPSRFSRYAPRLDALASKTGVPLPSLIVSFAVLHELTAILPLIGLFWGFQATGLGGRIVHEIKDLAREPGSEGWSLRNTLVEWVIEGETRVDRVAARYGWFGYEKGEGRRIHGGRSSEVDSDGRQGADLANKEREEMTDRLKMMTRSRADGPRGAAGSDAAASVASALGAYVVTKALLPLRIGASLYLSPAFSRGALEPLRRLAARAVRNARSG